MAQALDQSMSRYCKICVICSWISAFASCFFPSSGGDDHCDYALPEVRRLGHGLDSHLEFLELGVWPLQLRRVILSVGGVILRWGHPLGA